MTGDETPGIFRLRTMLPAAIVLWTATFWFVHGPMVFAYLAMHAATTGVFLIAIYRSDRVRSTVTAPLQAVRVAPKATFDSQTQAKRAVAS